MLTSLLALTGLVMPVFCWPWPNPILQPRATAVMPQVANYTLLANVTSPVLNRDSCGSARFGSRMLWTCRDTLGYDPSTNKSYGYGPVTNTASWADYNSYAYPLLQPGPKGAGSNGSNNILLMYGGHSFGLPAFYPPQADQCPDGGACSDQSRWAIWPDQPPVVTTSASDGSATGYTWIPNTHLASGSFQVENNPPSFALWRVSYIPNSNTSVLPNVTLLSENFWRAGQIGYGDIGSLVGSDGNVYLYGASKGGQALARVAPGSVETKSAYSYYYNGAWNATIPNINDTAAAIPNAGAGGQGTFYYSNDLNSYVWIGQASPSTSADFYLTTAPAPQGPWITPYHIFSGANGDAVFEGGSIGSYTLQAHPDMLNPADQHGIFITWTQQFKNTTYSAYVTPLVYLAFK